MPEASRHVGIYIDAAPGPIARARSIIEHLQAQVTVLSSGPIPQSDGCVHHQLPPSRRGLPPVVDPTAFPVTGPDTVAWLAEWIHQEAPDLLVVDGSSDVALVGRLAGVPVVPVRRFGRPPGAGERALEHVAAAWLAPYPAVLEPETTSASVRFRTLHAGLMSPLQGRRLGKDEARRRLGLDRGVRHVTIVTGAEGLGAGRHEVVAAARAATGWSFSVIGRCGGQADGASPANVRIEGWLDDPLPHLVAADVVVAGASLSSVSDVAVVRRPLALVPRPSHGNAEARLARAVADLHAAVVLETWPQSGAWPGLLADLLALEPRGLRKLSDGRGARRAAEWIDAWASSPPPDAAAELATSLTAQPGPRAERDVPQDGDPTGDLGVAALDGAAPIRHRRNAVTPPGYLRPHDRL